MIKDCKALLLCSDGFWEHITEEEMLDLLINSHSVDEWLERMEEKVEYYLTQKKMDNYSAIAIWNMKYKRRFHYGKTMFEMWKGFR